MGTVVELRPVADPAPSAAAPGKRITMDDGHTRIAHGLLEELMQVKYKLSGREHSVLLVVIRKTYGYMKTEDWIALSQFELMTGIAKSNCVKIIRGLVDRKILNRNANGNDQRLAINTNIGEWLSESPYKKAQSARRKGKNNKQSDSTISASDSTISASDSTPTRDKDNNKDLKDIVTTPVMTSQVDQSVSDNHVAEQRNLVCQSEQPKTKPRKTAHKFTDEDMAFAVYMAKCVDAVNGTEDKRRNLTGWADLLRKMRKIDQRDPEVIAAVFNWCNQDPFEQMNIQSPKSLRNRFAQIHGKYNKATQNGMNHENHNANGQQHSGQQDPLKDISWIYE